MVVASTRDAIMMVEAGSYEVPEEVILEGISKAFNANLLVIDLIDELAAQVGRPKFEVTADTETERAAGRSNQGHSQRAGQRHSGTELLQGGTGRGSGPAGR